jgi:hypothetical protein
MNRNIDVGVIVDKVFKSYQQYFVPLVSVAAILFLIDAAFRFAGNDHWWLGLIGGILSLVLTHLYTGFVVELANDTRDGQLDASIGGLMSKVTPVLGTLIIAAIVVGIATFFGLIACILPGIALLTLWAVVAPAIVIERLGVFEAMGRSWNMVKTSFWQTLGVIFVFWVITLVVVFIAGLISVGGGTVVYAIVSWIVAFLLAPLQALASSHLFFELKAIEGTAVTQPPTPSSTWGTPQAPQSPFGGPEAP